MRATVTPDKSVLDELVAETQTKNKSAAVKKAIAVTPDVNSGHKNISSCRGPAGIELFHIDSRG